MAKSDPTYAIVCTSDFFGNKEDAQQMAEILERKRGGKVKFSVFKCMMLNEADIEHQYNFAVIAREDIFDKLEDATRACHRETEKRKNEALRFTVIHGYFI